MPISKEEAEGAVKVIQSASRLFEAKQVVLEKARMDEKTPTRKEAEKPLNLEDIVFPSTPPTTPKRF